jgi:hypothetical protein
MKTVGLRWDFYLPSVEGQITRDLIALQSSFGSIIVIYNGDEPNGLVSALGLKSGIGDELADMWIVYTTQEGHQVDAPEHAKEVIKRDMFVAKTDISLDGDPHPGYYMKPQGRIGKPRLSQLPKPTHTGQTDPAIIFLWGAAK